MMMLGHAAHVENVFAFSSDYGSLFMARDIFINRVLKVVKQMAMADNINERLVNKLIVADNKHIKTISQRLDQIFDCVRGLTLNNWVNNVSPQLTGCRAHSK